jgi:hypothetical protein
MLTIWTIIANYVVVLLLMMMELESQVDHDEQHIADEILSKISSSTR